MVKFYVFNYRASGGIGYELFKNLAKENDTLGISHTKKLKKLRKVIH